MTQSPPPLASTPARRPFLWKLGLHRRELRAWALYDWANSVFMTHGLLIFPIFFSDVAAAALGAEEATRRYSLVTGVSMVIVALLSPILGAIADYRAMKKKMLGFFLVMGVAATAAMFFIDRDEWLFASAVFLLANTGVTSSLVFYESLLPHVADESEVHRVSTAGYALGYLGSSILMVFTLLTIRSPGTFGFPDVESATRFSFLCAAVWWLGFSLPLFRQVREPAVRLERDERPGLNPVAVGFRRLRETLGEIRGYRQAFLFLLAFFIYNDGIGTIIRMASIYGREIGIAQGSLMVSLLIVQLVGIPFSFMFGSLADRIGAKPAIFLALGIYFVVAVLGYGMDSAREFFLLCVLVGMVQGGSQALSRSVFSNMVPKHKSSEFFAFYSVFEKFAGILGPFLFAFMIGATGSSRSAILSIIAFFVLGGILLAFVDVEEGQRVARESDARAA